MIKNIFGLKFFRLKVQKFTRVVNEQARWLCLCDCGKETEVSGAELRRGNTKSCGCLRIEKAKQNQRLKYDLSNQAFGKLKVLSFSHFSKHRSRWNCLCECGKTVVVAGHDLLDGNTKSCGCFCIERRKYLNSGKNSRFYNPNLTDQERIEGKNRSRNPLNREWRERVFNRDGYKCILTNKKGKICAHHLESWHCNKNLRYVVGNGVTILTDLHKLFHKLYGSKNNTQSQFAQFRIRFYNGEFTKKENTLA